MFARAERKHCNTDQQLGDTSTKFKMSARVMDQRQQQVGRHLSRSQVCQRHQHNCSSSQQIIEKLISLNCTANISRSCRLALISNCLAILLVIAQLNSLIVQPTGAARSAAASSSLSSVTPTSTFDTSSSNLAHDQDPEQLTSSNNNNNNNLPVLQVSHKSPLNGRQFGDTINDIQIECNSNNIVVTLQTNQGFNGMIYPKGMGKNSTCMMEYHQMTSNITYYLPLKSCNTMSTNVEDGVEYFNTVMVQPHRRLVTNQGRGYHIRCRYQTKERTITNQDQQLSVNLTQVTPSVMGSASMPQCTMRIYGSSDLQHEVSAENVRIGDELHLVITLDDQDVYGMLVTNCLVRDGMNWGEQTLIDDRGCPVDEEIMPEFVYAKNLTRASVTFQAHKFPYTSSVYYQCNVRLCFRDSGCAGNVPPNCSTPPPTAPHQHQQQGTGANKHYKATSGGADGDELESGSNDLVPVPQRPLRQANGGGARQRDRRWVDAGELDGVASEELLRTAGSSADMSIEVSSGLHVAEREPEPAPVSSAGAGASADTANQEDPLMMAATNDDPEERIGANGSGGGGSDPTDSAGDTDGSAKERQRQSEREFCLSLRKFAIIVSLISLLLMTAIIILIACLIKRRNRQKLESQLNSTYDHHNGHGGASPYSNRAYCRD